MATPDRSLYLTCGGHVQGDDIGLHEIVAKLIITIRAGRATVLANGEPLIESTDSSIIASVALFVDGLCGLLGLTTLVLEEHVNEAAQSGWTFSCQRQTA